MGKAITGAVEIAGGVALAFVPGGQLFASQLLMAGIGSEIGALGQMLGHTGGMNVTTRQPAGLRQIIRGTQRVPGTIVYASTTGSSKRQYNMVVVVATHSVDALQNMYLDGRRVIWQPGSNKQMACGAVSNPASIGVTLSGGAISALALNNGGTGYFNGYTEVNPGLGAGVQYNARVRIVGDGTGARATATIHNGVCNGITLVSGGQNYTHATAYVDGAYIFGGYADPGTYYGPNGVHYSFGSEVFCVPHWGDETAATVDNTDLYNNDPTWAPTSEGTPYLGGCTWIYLKLEADSGTFPQFPELRFTVRGKDDLYDPRTGTTGYTDNWALHIADAITDPVWGLGDNSVNQAQLIAAANVCDEQVTCNAPSMVNGLLSYGTSTEKRYTLHWHYDTGTAPGDAIQRMMDAAAGRLSRISGEWFIWPAYWQGPAFSFDEGALVDSMQWAPKRSLNELFNRVTGTYTAANYPYGVAGDLYDSNGYWEGQTQNNFPYSFQPTSYPMYAADQLHGYGTGVDVYLQQDSGIYLPKEVPQPCVLSISQAQRVAKIMLLRNRQQGTGILPMNLAAWQMQPTDTFSFSSKTFDWTNKTLEVQRIKFASRKDDKGTTAYYVELQVAETDQSIYEWALTEELNIYDVPVFQAGWGADTTVAAPTSVTLEDDTSTAMLLADGTDVPRLQISWPESTDPYVLNGGYVQVQWQDASAVLFNGAWVDVGTLTGTAQVCYVPGVETVTSINAHVRFVRSNGATSAWAQNSTPHIRPIGGPITWRIGSGASPTFQYPTGVNFESLQPAQLGADVTAQNKAQAINVPDTRSVNEPPSWYRALGVGVYSEFKQQSVIAGLGTGSFVLLYTEVKWYDTTGGLITQWYTDEVNDLYQRLGSSDDSTWQAWIKVQAGADVTAQNALTLLQNPNFANGLTGWTGGTYSSAIAAPTGTPGSPTNVAQISSASALYTGFNNNTRFPFPPGNVVSASCWINGASGTGGNVCVQLVTLDINGNEIAWDNGNIVNPGNGWTNSRVVIAAGSTAASAYIRLLCLNSVGAWLATGFTGAIQANNLDEVPDGTNHLRMPTSIYGSSGNAVDLNGNLKLKNTAQNVGVTANPSVATTWADLPELGSGNSAMTMTLKGNPIFIGTNLVFASESSGGVITSLNLPFALNPTTGSSPPGIGITITGDGSGASATVTWAMSGSAPSFTWTPTLHLVGGSNYTTATVTSSVASNGDSGYTSGTYNSTCTVSTQSPNANVPIQFRALMDGSPVMGPVQVMTDGAGHAVVNATQMLFPAVGPHGFQIQAQLGATTKTAVSTNRSFQLIELG